MTHGTGVAVLYLLFDFSAPNDLVWYPSCPAVLFAFFPEIDFPLAHDSISLFMEETRLFLLIPLLILARD